MTEPSSYKTAAQAYADGVRALYSQPLSGGADRASERGGPGDVTANHLTAQAEKLVPLSADFTRVAAARLEGTDPAMRIDAGTQLLTKALTDLQISAELLRAATDEEAGILPTQGTNAVRGVGIGGPPDMEENLQFLLGESGATRTLIDRAATLPTDGPAARAQLTQLASETLDLIRERAGKTGQAAISGLLGLGMSEVAQAAGVVGMQIADLLGVGEKASRLYALFREFLLNAYNSLLSLLGPTLAKVAGQKVLDWVSDLTKGEQFTKLLDRLYETSTTQLDLRKEIGASTAVLEKFVAAIQGVDALGIKFGQQITVIEKLLKGLRLFGAVPVAVVPQGKLLMASAYTLLGGYVILTGADFVDAPHLRVLDRAPGVRKIVEGSIRAM